MADELTFGEQLILAEEGRAPPRPPEEADRVETVVLERTDFTTADAFTVHGPSRELPIDGPGTLVQLLVVAGSDDFDIFLEVDGQHVIDEAYTDLQPRSADLSRITASTSGGDEVFSATDYEFQQSINAVISPNSSITFSRQRIEVDLVRDVFT